jgi:3-hydroxyisobutyrate dehydrogenase
MLRRDFSAGFYVEHLNKDLGIVMDSARNMGISLPGTALGMQLYNSLMALDGARLGTHALQLVYEATNNVKLPDYDKLKPQSEKKEAENLNGG